MRLAIKLAIRNLIGAGLRTWLNVIVLSFSYVVIIWMNGVMIGWEEQAKHDMKDWQIGGGQYWHHTYDTYDPFTITDSHDVIPTEFEDEIARGDMEPILIVQGTLYPQGRMQSVAIKGINPGQTIFKQPTHKLDTTVSGVPAIIGAMMAKDMKIKKGDYVTLRWRDANGTFDATDICVVDIFATNVPAVENAQVYVSLDTLQSLSLLEGHTTILTFRDGGVERPRVEGWTLKTSKELTKTVDKLIKTKSTGLTIFYFILILLAMLAIFDTMVLSIFRRQKEIGTYIALGYTRREVVGLFTVEGAMYSIFAALVGAAYGLPILAWQAKVGWTMPMDVSELGMAIAQTLYPVYSVGLVVSTILIVVITTTIVSYWPSRKIAKMNPTEALRGKIQ